MEIHSRENNDDSEITLNEGHEKFSKQCETVLRLLKQGQVLTTLNAPSFGILSLPRRILDLKQNGIAIQDRWLHDEHGKRTIKEWFIPVPKPPTKKDLQEWFRSYQEEGFVGKSIIVQASLF